jgi:DNA repair and recombination protein RAD52
MMFNPDQIKELSAKLDASHVKQREQAGRKLSYIEGWHAIAEANRIFGYDAWTRETLDIRVVAEGPRKVGKPPNQRDGFGVSYIAKVRVIVDGVAREGIGAGHGIDTDLGLAHESAIKEAETDAMKRALMTFGNPFGLALYDKTQENVETHSNSAPQQGRNAAPVSPPSASSRPAGAATLSALGETFHKVMLLAKTKDELGDWMAANAEEMKTKLGEAEASNLRILAAARYRELPAADAEAAE